MKKIDLKFAIYVMVVLALVMFNSGCEKENMEDLYTSNFLNGKIAKGMDVSLEMRHFDTYEELREELSKLSKMTPEELDEYEKTIGFNSFGKIADKVYFSIFGNEQALEQVTKDDLLMCINNNNEFIQIVNEDDGTESAETRYYRSAYRYVMNRDCMFQVEDDIYRVFENGHVICSEKDNEILKKMTNEKFDVMSNDDNQNIHIFKYSSTPMIRETAIFDYLVVRDSVNSNGKERVKIWIEYNSAAEPNAGTLHILTRGQRKTAGIFYNALRHITNHLTIKIHYPNGLFQTITNNTATADAEYKLESYQPTWFCWVGSYMCEITGYCFIPAVRYTFPN